MITLATGVNRVEATKGTGNENATGIGKETGTELGTSSANGIASGTAILNATAIENGNRKSAYWIGLARPREMHPEGPLHRGLYPHHNPIDHEHGS